MAGLSPEVQAEIEAQVLAAREGLKKLLPDYFNQVVKAVVEELKAQGIGGVTADPEQIARRAVSIAKEEIAQTVAEARQEMASTGMANNGNGQHAQAGQPQGPAPASASPGQRITSALFSGGLDSLTNNILKMMQAWQAMKQPDDLTMVLNILERRPILQNLLAVDPLASAQTLAQAVGVGLRARQGATGQGAWPVTRGGAPVNPLASPSGSAGAGAGGPATAVQNQNPPIKRIEW